MHLADPSDVIARLRAAGCVFAEDEAELLVAAAGTAAELEALLARRVAGEPLEYVVGWAEFCGRRIEVCEPVFVPRIRTEFLVARAVALARAGAVVLDMGCGSGAAGVAVAAAVEDVELHATDVDPSAADCARSNVVPMGGTVYAGDLFAPLPTGLRGRVDLLLANAPYVPTAELGLLPREAREFEATVALDGGADGLDVQRRIAAEATAWLAPGGHLLVETSRRQAQATLEIVRGGGMAARIEADEELEATVVIGRADTPS